MDQSYVTEPIRVLHVDDNREFLDLAAEALSREGPFEVTTETDPAAAVERFEADSFDAVVSDYEMPGMDGVELLGEIRDRDRDVPCLVFTGKGSEAVASEAFSVGVTDYLQKATGLDQFTLLANRLENAVARARTTSELRREKRRRDRILEAAPMGIVVHDETGTVTLVNERARALLDADIEEMDAKGYAEASWRLLDSDGTPIARESLPFNRVKAADAPIRDAEYTIEYGDGNRQDIGVNGAPLHDDEGAFSGAVVVFWAT